MTASNGWPEVPTVYFKSNHASPTAVDVNQPDGSVLHIEYGAVVREYALRLGLTMQDVVRAFGQLRDAFGPLRDAGVLEDTGPTEPMARALWLRQNRNTGPGRPSGPTAHRPRRHR